MRIPVSVIIPCFNCGSTINRAISSVYSQTAIPQEVILVDDFSSDETYSVLLELKNKYREIIIIKMEVNQGAGTARNLGWNQASQPYVAFLDADDSWHRDKLRLQYDFMEKNQNISMTGHQCTFLHESEKSSKLLSKFSFQSIGVLSILLRNPFNTPTVMLRRQIPLRFKDGKRYAEDFLLWQQIVLHNMKVVFIQLPLAYVHKPFYGAGGLSKNLWEMEKGEIENFFILYKKNYICFFSFLIAIIFSIIKFIKRLALDFIKKIRG